jgi:hypothetical protein
MVNAVARWRTARTEETLNDNSVVLKRRGGEDIDSDCCLLESIMMRINFFFQKADEEFEVIEVEW